MLSRTVTRVTDFYGIMETGKQNGRNGPRFPCISVTAVTDFYGIMEIGERNGSAINWRLARFLPIRFLFMSVTAVTDFPEIMETGNTNNERAALMSLATVELFIGTRFYGADSDGEDFATDSTEQVISCDWEEFQSREEFVEEIAGEFRKRGASFEFTGTRTASAESYQHPITGVWEELSMCFLSGADDALQVAVVREVDKR